MLTECRQDKLRQVGRRDCGSKMDFEDALSRACRERITSKLFLITKQETPIFGITNTITQTTVIVHSHQGVSSTKKICILVNLGQNLDKVRPGVGALNICMGGRSWSSS